MATDRPGYDQTHPEWNGRVRRFQSAWVGIIVHSSASVFAVILVLTLVLD